MNDKNVQEYLKLRKRAEALQSELDRTQGALDRELARLRDEHGCKDEAEAKKLLAKLEKEERKQDEEFARALERFKANWGSYAEVME